MMQKKGKIVGFSSYTQEQLEKMRGALQISLSQDQLRFCASYYQNHAKRDPFIDELKMLDRLANGASVPMLTVAPTELLTKDSALASTFADLMSKRRTLFPNKRTPCTLGEIFPILNEALARVGKVSTTKNTVTLWDTAKQHVLPNEALIGVRSANGRVRMTEHTVAPTGPDETDFWAILLPVGTRSYTDHKGAEQLLCGDCAEYIKQALTVRSAGLMETLLQASSGLWIDLSHLSQAGEDVPLSVMTDFYAGRHLIRLSGRNMSSVMQEARTHGLRMQPFAMVTSDPQFVFADKKEVLFSLDSAFLRALPRLHTTALTLNGGCDKTPSKIAHAPLSASVCPYLCHTDDLLCEQVAQIKNTLFATATVTETDNAFYDAMRAILAPLLTLAANGGDLCTLRLSAYMELSQEIKDELCVGNAFSLALGIYRVLAELALPLSATKFTSVHGADRTELTVFASVDGKSTVPTRFTTEGNRIYCIAPDVRADGTYDMKSFRNLLAYLGKKREEGVLVSARVLCGEAVTDGLVAMSSRKVDYRITQNEIAAEEALPLAILIEASSPIEARLVGVTVKVRCDETDLPLLSPMRSMIWSARPQITLIASGNDCHAALLRAYLEEKGADAYLFSDKTGDADALSRSLLGSQYLILCGVSVYRPTERLSFALDTMMRAGGKILSVKKNAVIGNCPVITYPEGLPIPVIEQICSSTDKL